MAYGLSNGHVTDDVTWPPKVLRGSTVGYPSDSLASCYRSFNLVIRTYITHRDNKRGLKFLRVAACLARICYRPSVRLSDRCIIEQEAKLLLG